MVADPLVLTFAGTPISLNRINQDGYTSEYLFRNSTKEYRAKIRHSTTKADSAGQVYDRHNMEVNVLTFAVGAVPSNYEKFYVVIEGLPADTSFTVPKALCDALLASTNALGLSLKQWQN
jgi:hypothetical protein